MWRTEEYLLGGRKEQDPNLLHQPVVRSSKANLDKRTLYIRNQQNDLYFGKKEIRNYNPSNKEVKQVMNLNINQNDELGDVEKNRLQKLYREKGESMFYTLNGEPSELAKYNKPFKAYTSLPHQEQKEHLKKFKGRKNEKPKHIITDGRVDMNDVINDLILKDQYSKLKPHGRIVGGSPTGSVRTPLSPISSLSETVLSSALVPLNPLTPSKLMSKTKFNNIKDISVMIEYLDKRGIFIPYETKNTKRAYQDLYNDYISAINGTPVANRTRKKTIKKAEDSDW